jgi:hypothetical protein
MPRAGTETALDRLHALRQGWRSAWRALWLAFALVLGAGRAAAAGAELANFDLERLDDGLVLSYTVDFELSRAVEEALAKSVPLYFVAEATLYRDRWYWRDKRVAQVTRSWRIVYQPLTSTYRVTFGDISQTYASRAEALAAVRRPPRWKLAEPGQIEEGSRHYVEFSFRLDTSLLPRPMQIGIGGQSDWALAVERVQRLP